MQYERWGIEDFATRYLQDSDAVEQEARDNADRYVELERTRAISADHASGAKPMIRWKRSR